MKKLILTILALIPLTTYAVQVEIQTSAGNIKVELDEKKAPKTVENFLYYAKSGFYEGTIFHRVIKGFVIQGGGYDKDLNYKKTKDPIKLESNNGLSNITGSIAMARTNDPDSATSQFYINLNDNKFLDYAPNNPGYAVFGQVISGLDVVMTIGAAQTDSQDVPQVPIIIEKVIVE